MTLKLPHRKIYYKLQEGWEIRDYGKRNVPLLVPPLEEFKQTKVEPERLTKATLRAFLKKGLIKAAKSPTGSGYTRYISVDLEERPEIQWFQVNEHEFRASLGSFSLRVHRPGKGTDWAFSIWGVRGTENYPEIETAQNAAIRTAQVLFQQAEDIAAALLNQQQ
jgi:hypothetical protein